MPAARNAGAKMTVFYIVSFRYVPLQDQPLTQHNLNIEPYIIPGVFVEEYSSNVSNTLCKTTAAQSNHIRPCLVPDTKVDLEDKCEAEVGSEEGVGPEARIVGVDCVFDFAPRGSYFSAPFRGRIRTIDECVHDDETKREGVSKTREEPKKKTESDKMDEK